MPRLSFMVAVDQPLHRGAHLFLGDAAHLEQARFQLFELVLEMPYDAFDRLHAITQTAR